MDVPWLPGAKYPGCRLTHVDQMGHRLAQTKEDGRTYTINDDGEVITMVFPKEEIADVPVGVDVGGTFALVVDEEEEYVTLNGILFSKA